MTVTGGQLTFLHHWGFGGCSWVTQPDVAGEVGLAFGQVLEQQAADVAWKDTGFGAVLVGGVLLLVRVGGVEEPLALHVFAEGFRWLSWKCVLAVHPEVVLGQGAVGQLDHLLSRRKAWRQRMLEDTLYVYLGKLITSGKAQFADHLTKE